MRKADRSDVSQVEDLVNSTKVIVFLLDENQNMRPDEIGSSELIRTEMKRLGIPLKEYDLEVQFRCGGCTEYSDWINYLLEFSNKKPVEIRS